MKVFVRFRLFSALCLLASSARMRGVVAQDLEGKISSFFNAFFPSELEETLENMTQQLIEANLSGILSNLSKGIEETVEDITQQVVETNFSGILSNFSKGIEETVENMTQQVIQTKFSGILSNFSKGIEETVENITQQVIETNFSGILSNFSKGIEETVEGITQQVVDTKFTGLFSNISTEIEESLESMSTELEGKLEGITQQAIDIDLAELLPNISIPEASQGAINVDVLFSEVFAGILAFFSIPGYEEFERAVGNPFYADPVPFGSQCNFCDGTYDKTEEFAGLRCEEWEIFAGFSKGEECSILRATAVKHCGCNIWGDAPAVLPPICPLCMNKTQNDKLSKLYTFEGADRVLPSLSNTLRCSDILGLPSVDGLQRTCADIGKLSNFCGCEFEVPRQEGQCTLCRPGTLPRDRDKIVLYGDDKAGTPNLTCTEVHNKFATQENSFVGDPSCNAAHRHLSSMLGANVQVFCGCPSQHDAWSDEDLAPAKPCEPCAAGYIVRFHGAEGDVGLTTSDNPQRAACRDWVEELKKLSANDPICDALANTAMPDCCIPIPRDDVPPPNEIVEAAAKSAALVLLSFAWGLFNSFVLLVIVL